MYNQNVTTPISRHQVLIKPSAAPALILGVCWPSLNVLIALPIRTLIGNAMVTVYSNFTLVNMHDQLSANQISISDHHVDHMTSKSDYFYRFTFWNHMYFLVLCSPNLCFFYIILVTEKSQAKKCNLGLCLTISILQSIQNDIWNKQNLED